MFIFGQNLPKNKNIRIIFLYCFGIGFVNSSKIVSKIGSNLYDKKSLIKFKNFNIIAKNYIVLLIRRFIKKTLGVALKNLIFIHLKKLRILGTKKSINHTLFLPVRGQKTKYNAQTQKSKRQGRKKTPIAKKKK